MSFPWDCYTYRFNRSIYSYTYTGSANFLSANVAQLGAPAASISYPVQPPTPNPDAYQALLLFANDQLGAAVDPVYAGSATTDVQQVMQRLPLPIQAYFLRAVGSSGSTAWGLLSGGAAGVAVGDCASHPANCADHPSNQLSSASAGIYGLLTNEAVVSTPPDALKLITTVYPKLNGLQFTQITDIEPGVAFRAITSSLGYDTATQQPISSPKIVYAGVVGVGDQAFVYALVGVGQGIINSLGG